MANCVGLHPSSRAGVVDYLVEAAAEGPLVAGLDFSFSFPRWVTQLIGEPPRLVARGCRLRRGVAHVVCAAVLGTRKGSKKLRRSTSSAHGTRPERPRLAAQVDLPDRRRRCRRYRLDPRHAPSRRLADAGFADLAVHHRRSDRRRDVPAAADGPGEQSSAEARAEYLANASADAIVRRCGAWPLRPKTASTPPCRLS